MDGLDRTLLNELLSDSKRSIRSIARKLGLSTSTAHDRIRRLEKRGVIKRFTLELDPDKLGLSITVLILVRVKGPYIVDVERKLADNPNIVAIYDITGEYDVALIAKFGSMSQVDRFVKGLLKNPAIERTVTSVVLNTVKESYCPDSLPPA